MKKTGKLSLALALGGVMVGAAAQAATFSVGAGRADVQFPASQFPIGEFAAQHDPLAVRVLVLNDGRKRVAIVVVDMTSLFDTSTAAFKNIVRDVDGVAPENIIVVAAHNFSSPHIFLGGGPGRPGVPQGKHPGGTPAAGPKTDYVALEAEFESAVRAAAQQAAVLKPATAGFGQGISHINVNRDVPTPDGWWIGANDAGFTDPSLAMVRFDGQDGKPLALLMNYAVQSSVMDQSERAAGGRLISSDIEGQASRYVEAHYGAVSAFLPGAAGDQSPYLQAAPYAVQPDGSISRTDLHEAGFLLVKLLGDRLGEQAVAVVDKIKTEQTPTLEVWRTSVPVTSQVSLGGKPPTSPVKSYVFRPGPKVNMPVVMIRIGDIVLVGVQPELNASLGTKIKAGSPFPDTMVVTMVDGAAKYLPDTQSYDRFEYEARSASYARGSGEVAAAEIDGLLKQWKQHKN